MDSQESQEVQSEIWSDQQFMNNIEAGIFEDSQELDNNNEPLKSDTNSSKSFHLRSKSKF